MIQRNYIQKLWNSVGLEKVWYLVSPTVASIICCVKSSIQLYHGTHNTWSWIEWTIYVFEIFLNGSEISVSSFTSSGYKLEKKNPMHCILRFGVVGGLTLDALSHAMPSSLSLLLLSPHRQKGTNLLLFISSWHAIYSLENKTCRSLTCMGDP